MSSQIKEKHVLSSIMDYLAVSGILAFRMNSGAVRIEKRFLRFGVPGMADIIAFKRYPATPIWIECKTERGKQSELQKSFQRRVEEHGHTYIVARSIDDLRGIL